MTCKVKLLPVRKTGFSKINFVILLHYYYNTIYYIYINTLACVRLQYKNIQ